MKKEEKNKRSSSSVRPNFKSNSIEISDFNEFMEYMECIKLVESVIAATIIFEYKSGRIDYVKMLELLIETIETSSIKTFISSEFMDDVDEALLTMEQIDFLIENDIDAFIEKYFKKH